MNASAKTMLRETKPTRHRCEFASSVDSKSKRRKRAQQHRLQERILQVNKKKATGETWLCASFRKSTSLKEGSIHASRKALLRVYDVVQRRSYV